MSGQQPFPTAITGEDGKTVVMQGGPSKVETMVRPIEVVETNTTEDPEGAAHIVMVPTGEPDQTPQAYVMRARIEGFPITAVCGHVFVPQKDPKPLPVCAPCKEFFQTNGKDLDNRGDLPDA